MRRTKSACDKALKDVFAVFWDSPENFEELAIYLFSSASLLSQIL